MFPILDTSSKPGDTMTSKKWLFQKAPTETQVRNS